MTRHLPILILWTCATCSLASYTLYGHLRKAAEVQQPQKVWLQPRIVIDGEDETPSSSSSSTSPGGSSSSSFTWAINVPQDPTCRRVLNVSIDIVGLQHSSPSALTLSLRHESSVAVLGRSGAPGTGRRFGSRSSSGSSSGHNNNIVLPFSSTPSIWTFQDVDSSSNIALGASATSSGSSYGADAARAVDGVVDGFMSSGGLFHSATAAEGRIYRKDTTNTQQQNSDSSDDAFSYKYIENWLEVDLLSSTAEVGAVRLFDRASEGYKPDILLITTHAIEAFPVTTSSSTSASSRERSTFRLRWRVSPSNDVSVSNSATTTTPPINVDAPAMRSDEIGTLPSNMKGSSMQSVLEATSLAGNVMVSRHVPTEAKNTGGIVAQNSFSWKVTFLNRAGLPPLEVDPEYSLFDHIDAEGVNITIEVLQRGRHHTWFDEIGRSSDVFAACDAERRKQSPTPIITPEPLFSASSSVPVRTGGMFSCFCGFAPGFLILSSSPIGNLSLDDALHHADVVHTQRLTCASSSGLVVPTRAADLDPLLPAKSSEYPFGTEGGGGYGGYGRETLVPIIRDGKRKSNTSTSADEEEEKERQKSSIQARYVRIQRADFDLLWLAELEVFSSPFGTIDRGGRQQHGDMAGGAVLPGSYESESNLRGAFQGLPASGPWLLRVDKDAATTRTTKLKVPKTSSSPSSSSFDSTLNSSSPVSSATSAAGANMYTDNIPSSISTWVLHLTCDDVDPDLPMFNPFHSHEFLNRTQLGGGGGGWVTITSNATTRSFEAPVTVTVHTYPSRGRIYPYNASSSASSSSAFFVPPNPLYLPPSSPAEGVTTGSLPASLRAAMSTAQSLLVSADATVKTPNADFAQCDPATGTHLNADGSQTSCADEGKLLKQRTDGAAAWSGGGEGQGRNPTLMNYLTSMDASISAHNQATLTWRENEHSVLYIPPEDGFQGHDAFTFSIHVDQSVISSTAGSTGKKGTEDIFDEIHAVQFKIGTVSPAAPPAGKDANECYPPLPPRHQFQEAGRSAVNDDVVDNQDTHDEIPHASTPISTTHAKNRDRGKRKHSSHISSSSEEIFSRRMAERASLAKKKSSDERHLPQKGKKGEKENEEDDQVDELAGVIWGEY